MYFFQFSIFSHSKTKIDKQVSTLQLQFKIKLPDMLYVLKTLNLLFLTFTRLIFRKIKFKGKGYYLYKSMRNTITPQFGYAHRIYKYNNLVSVNFLSKTKVFFFGLSKSDIFSLSYFVKQIRPLNIFTGRGVRFSKTIVYKKTGKVSLYR